MIGSRKQAKRGGGGDGGRGGGGGGGCGACTSALLKILYHGHQTATGNRLTYLELLLKMRGVLLTKDYTQIPLLSSSRPLNVDDIFQLVPSTTPKHQPTTRRAVMIGINYTGMKKGQLSGCHNDVQNVRHKMLQGICV